MQFSRLKLGITLLFWLVLLLIRRRRPSRVALASSSYAAKQLARIPPGEGFAVLRRALVTTRLLPAGSHDGGRRVGKERVGV